MSLVFNGEIYNYRQLRTELEGLGEIFHTTSDSEVLLALYARMGEGMLPRLRGMFAFAIWDSHLRELFLARDPYGIKPLYYAQTKEGVLFASQVRGLIASGQVSTEIEPAGMAGFYLWGSVPEPWTIFRGVMSLPAGSWMRIRSSDSSSPIKWYDVRESWNQAQIRCTEEEVRERVRSAVTDSIAAHLVADVPVSVFLSGGIDSGTVIGLAAQLGAKVEGVTIGFKEFERASLDEATSGSLDRFALWIRPPHQAGNTRGIRGGPSAVHECNGSADHRRLEHLVREQSRGRARL